MVLKPLQTEIKAYDHKDNVLAWQATLVADRSCSNCRDGTPSVPCSLIKLGVSIHINEPNMVTNK